MESKEKAMSDKELLESIRSYVDSRFPGQKLSCIVIQLTSGEYFSFHENDVHGGPPRKVAARKQEYMTPAEIEARDRNAAKRAAQVVYFIQEKARGSIKIGISESPQERLAMLKTGSAHELVLLGVMQGGMKKEAELHERFAAHRISGEWFNVAILDDVMEIIEKYGKPK